MKTRTIIISIVVLLAAVAAVWGGWMYLKKKPENQFRFGKIEKGSLVQTVRATGIVQPIKLVQVGTQVNGPVRKLYVDYNNRVKAGDLVAQIDPTVYEAQLARDEANLKQSQATVEQIKARLAQAEKELERSDKLQKRDMLSTAELESAALDRDSLVAQLKVSEAAVEQSKAALSLSRANLGYTTIRSPVDGVVIARNVDEGQTVVASMSAQVLFQIATDLKEIQIVASIPEADIGKIQTGQPVAFTVDAYDQEFTGKVSQIRLSAATVQNVVTYPVVITAGNPDEKLYPNMTANISCEVARHDGILKVPNAALRFKPDTATATAGEESKRGSGKGKAGRANRGKIWIQKAPGQAPTGVPVKLGITDGVSTEVTPSVRPEAGRAEGAEAEAVKLEDGQEVILGVAEADTATQAKVVNPFTPQMPGGGRRPH